MIVRMRRPLLAIGLVSAGALSVTSSVGAGSTVPPDDSAPPTEATTGATDAPAGTEAPAAPHQGNSRRRRDRLQTRDRRVDAEHAVLQVDRDGVVSAVPEHLGGVRAAGRQPCGHRQVAGLEELAHPIRSHQVSAMLCRISDHGAT